MRIIAFIASVLMAGQVMAETVFDDFSGDAFVAVGAAHLPGETGVLNLLAKKGFSITRLPFAP